MLSHSGTESTLAFIQSFGTAISKVGDDPVELALLVLGLLANAGPNRSLKISHYCFIGGVAVFSGGLYAWVLTGHTFFVMVVPLGGLSLIAGWVAFVTAVVWSAKSDNGASD